MEATGSFSDVTLDAIPLDDDALELVSVRQLTGKRAWEVHPSGSDAAAIKKVGRVQAFVFHPSTNKCVGFLVKRPDAAMMFHRKDLFVSFKGFDIMDGRIIIGNAADAKGKGALKAIGADLDDCVLWYGLPVMCEDGTLMGTVSDVLCELRTGDVYSMEVGKDAAANALLGTVHISPDEICGFRMCPADEGSADGFPVIVVSNIVHDRPVEGGVAEKAGSATAVIAHNAKQAIDKVAPKAKEAVSAAGDAIDKGAYITGRQIGRTKGMFSSFKEEFDKALHDEGSDDEQV